MHCLTISPSPVASMVVCHGTLKCGDVLVAGQGWGKVRSMFDENRRILKEAPPSSPVLTVGWRQLPTAGEHCLQVCMDFSADGEDLNRLFPR